MTTNPSTAVVVYDPGLVDPEHVALAGFLGGYRGLTRDAYTLDLRQFVAFCGPTEPQAVRGPPQRHRGVRTRAGGKRSGDGHDRPTAVHGDRLLPLRRGGRPHRPLPGRPRPPSPHRLRVARHRPGPQRSRSPAPRGSPGPRGRARLDVAAGAQRAAGIRSHRGEHRSARPGARAPHADHRPQGRQDRHHPPCATPPPAPSTWPTASVPPAQSSRPATDTAWTATARRGSSVGWPAEPGSPSRSAPTPCATLSSPQPWTPASRYATSKRPPPTRTLARPCATTGPGSPSTATPPTSCPPTSQEQPADHAVLGA
jgi:hypothetical protein